MCAHTHAHKEASICVYYIYCGMCVHCPSSSSSRCWSSPLLLRFWLPRQQNTKYKKKKKKSCISSLCLALFFSLLSISLVFRPAVSSLPLSLSPLLLLALCTFMLLLYLLFRCPPYQFSLSRTLLPPFSLSPPPPLTLPLIIHWTNDCAPLCPTHTHKNTSLFFTTPLFTLLTHSLSPHSLDDLHDDATYNSNRLKRKTNKNELNRKA